MKRYLFLDNFRGFRDTVVPLADVNFLVGENSTGKTSVLTLLRLLSSPLFLMGADVGTDDVQLGHFGELVSAHSKDKTYFRIGIIDETPLPPPHHHAVKGIFLTYKEDQGIPQIYRATCIIDDRQADLKYEPEGSILYRLTDIAPYSAADHMRRSIPAILQSHGSEDGGWKQITIPEGLGKQFPLLLAINFVYQSHAASKPSHAAPLVLFGQPPIVWIAPIRTMPRRTYDEPRKSFSSDGSHTPYVIRRMLASKEDKRKFEAFMARAGRSSRLFQRIETKSFGPKNDSTAPFEVDAVLDGEALNLSWVGYGVSQSLPILVELLDRPKGAWFAIQQPEVHLHPRAQASLGDVFFEMAMRDSKHFLIETHSDFTIDRFRMNYRRKRSAKTRESLPEGQILFFERRDKRNTVTPLVIGKDGTLPADQPDGYRDFFIKEELALIGG